MRARLNSSGFTLIEVAIVVALFAVLAAIGWGSTRNQMPRYRLIRASKGLKSDLVSLKHLAVLTNRETRLTLVSSPGDCGDVEAFGGSWWLQAGDRSRGSKSWEFLPIDAPETGEDAEQGEGRVDLGDGGNRELKDVCLEDWESLHGPGTGNAESIVFSPRGWVRNPAADFNGDGYMEFVLTNQSALRMGVEDRVKVLVSRAGMVKMHSTLGYEMVDNPIGVGGSSKAR
jgi:prepilin-type N-terminal cleavage/methylation domain-containing protein